MASLGRARGGRQESGGGAEGAPDNNKTNMILDMYKCCFSRICIWSPSIEVDQAWVPVKDYMNNSSNSLH